MEKHSKIFIAGHRGLVGSAIVRSLQVKGYRNLLTVTHKELDLMDSIAVARFFEQEKPEYVFLAAAKVGGIMANNTYRAQFIFENLQIQNNVIHQSYLHGVKKLLFLGSSCVYPKNAPQPIKEEYLLTDELEYTNEPYAIAKIAGMKMCEAYNLQYGTNFMSVMPTNLFGPNDNFHLENSHVLPALIRKMHLSRLLEEGDIDGIKRDLGIELNNTDNLKGNIDYLIYLEKYGISKSPDNDQVTLKIWGSGKPMREFLWSEDMADACVFIMETLSFEDLKNDMQSGINGGNTKDANTNIYESLSNGEIRNSHINIGWGKEITIKDLAFLIKETVGFKGTLQFDSTKPDGTMRKLLDVTKLSGLGWTPKVKLDEGLRMLYENYLSVAEHASR